MASIEEENEGKVLVLRYSIKCEYRTIISGNIGSAVEEASRSLAANRNIDPKSIQFTVE